jgi:hypothetical protein
MQKLAQERVCQDALPSGALRLRFLAWFSLPPVLGWVCPRRAPRGPRISSQVWQLSGMTSSTLQPVESLTVGPSARARRYRQTTALSEGF